MPTTYLAPSVSPINGEALDDVFQTNIVGLTGIAGELVRPRWQPEPPNQPDFGTNWVAFGVQTIDADRYAYQKHDPTGNGGLGSDSLERDEKLKLLLSFYGPNSSDLLARYRDGLQLSQNREDLLAFGIKLTEVGEATILPALLKEKWVRRVDLTCFFMRRIFRSYNIPTVVADSLTINNEHYLTTIAINP